MHTFTRSKCSDDSGLIEGQPLLFHGANDILRGCLLNLGAFRRHIHCKEWYTRVDLVGHASFLAALVQSKEDQIGIPLARVEIPNHIFL